jgi:Protein of unknown function (DUF3443)
VSALLTPALRACAFLLCLAVISCGGGGDSLGGSGGSSSSGTGTGTGTVAPSSNVASVTVSAGPAGVNAINTLYTTVTVCVPGTTTCQTIDNIQVDTGSYGLRILSQVLTLSLPVATAASGGGLVECTEFVDGYSWGPVALVDLQISGETASSVPMQLIGDSRYPTAPSDCSSAAPTAENTVATFGANGILGIGPFAQDCGSYCATGIPEPIQYYGCTTSVACQGTLVPVAAQVQNPVTMFTTDNNGTIIILPSVASAGAANVTGSLIFGIDTESNNASGTETVLPVSAAAVLTTAFNGQTLDQSFIDSGSNATYFNDSTITQCPTSGSGSAGVSDFYCPSSPMTLTAAFVLSDNSTVNASFEVANANTVSDTVTAYPGLAGTNPNPVSFDWGLPFFYGRRVANAIEGAATSVGTGPYIAF